MMIKESRQEGKEDITSKMLSEKRAGAWEKGEGIGDWPYLAKSSIPKRGFCAVNSEGGAGESGRRGGTRMRY